MAVATLLLMCEVLGTSLEDITGTQAKAGVASKKRGPAPKLQQQLECLQALPKAKQRMVSEVLDSVLAAHQ